MSKRLISRIIRNYFLKNSEAQTKLRTSFPRVWEQMKHERFIVPHANHRINILERADVKVQYRCHRMNILLFENSEFVLFCMHKTSDEISSVMFQNKTEQSQGSLKGPEPSLNSHRK
ncbi:1-deoxy-11-beta-hydroxypentalenate dehydrogenase [Dirofilaria immitis]